MKKIFAAVAAALITVTSFSVLSGCDVAKDIGNNAVNSAKDYAKSEIGIDGDKSALISKAGDYAKNELGLNGDNDAIEGTWKQLSDGTVWTFDGKSACHLKDAATGTDSDGTYRVDASAATVTVSMDGETVYNYKLRKTLSNETLELSSGETTYKLSKQ